LIESTLFFLLQSQFQTPHPGPEPLPVDLGDSNPRTKLVLDPQAAYSSFHARKTKPAKRKKKVAGSDKLQKQPNDNNNQALSQCKHRFLVEQFSETNLYSKNNNSSNRNKASPFPASPRKA
jgi:hypothetical protein